MPEVYLKLPLFETARAHENSLQKNLVLFH